MALNVALFIGLPMFVWGLFVGAFFENRRARLAHDLGARP